MRSPVTARAEHNQVLQPVGAPLGDGPPVVDGEQAARATLLAAVAGAGERLAAQLLPAPAPGCAAASTVARSWRALSHATRPESRQQPAPRMAHLGLCAAIAADQPRPEQAPPPRLVTATMRTSLKSGHLLARASRLGSPRAEEQVERHGRQQQPPDHLQQPHSPPCHDPAHNPFSFP
jgi:hypothetical protein